MRKLLALLISLMVAMTLAVAGFAQKHGNDNRPPKDNPKVVEKPKSPPSNDRGNQNNNKRGKP